MSTCPKCGTDTESTRGFLALIRELEEKVKVAREAMEANIKRLKKRPYRSALHHCDFRVQCEDAACSLREALEKIGGKP